MKAPLSYVPALPAAIGITAGILADSIGCGATTAIAGGGLFVLLYVLRRHYAALCALSVAIGVLLAMSHHPPSSPSVLWGNKHTYTAEVLENRENATSTTYIAKIRSVDTQKCEPFSVLINVSSVAEPSLPGTVIRFEGTLQPIEHKEEIPLEINYADHYLRRGIMSRCYLNTQAQEVSAPRGINAFANEARRRIFNAIVDSPVNSSTASFLIASILGDRNFITPDEYTRYRDTGVAHILALSGLHVGIIASMLAFLLMPLRLSMGGRYLSSGITLIAVWCYALIAGFTPSILRATVMITVFILARLIGRGTNGYNSLSISVVVIMCVDPVSLFSPGFQLSAAAVATILMFGNMLPDGLRRYPVLYLIAGMMITSVSAMIGTGIISAYYFNNFPILFIPANVLTGLLFPFILGGGIILSAFSAMGVRLDLLGNAVDMLHSLMQSGINLLGSVDEAVIHQVYFSSAVIVPYAMAVIMLAISLHYRERVLWIMTGVLTIATFITAKVTNPSIPSAEMYIPSSLTPTIVIMRAGDKAWLYTPDCNQTDNLMTRANRRYGRFLLSRGCGDSFLSVTDTLDHTSFRVQRGIISAVDKTIAVAGKHIQDIPDGLVHVDYALICKDFAGTIRDVTTRLMPDTILLGTDIHPSRRKSLIRQCGDSIPYRNLHVETLSKVW